jgi:hypothetical protein
MLNSSFICSAAFGLFLLAPVSSGWGNVKVTHKPVEVEHKSFDHNNPPKDLGLEKEGAVTVSEFDLQIGLGIAPGDKIPQRTGKCRETLVIQNVNLTIALKITLWLPDNATEKLKVHEEGHREMTEKVYSERSDKAAKAAGALIDGKRLIAEADNCDEVDKAVEQTIGEANKKVYHAYLTRTADASARAGEIYDEITRHGIRMDIDEKTAAAQAFAREADEEKQAATRPAGPAQAATKPTTRSEIGPLQIKK